MLLLTVVCSTRRCLVVFLSVAATLRLKFAQYITFGNALGSYMNKTANYFFYDFLVAMVDDEYDKW